MDAYGSDFKSIALPFWSGRNAHLNNFELRINRMNCNTNWCTLMRLIGAYSPFWSPSGQLMHMKFEIELIDEANVCLQLFIYISVAPWNANGGCISFDFHPIEKYSNCMQLCGAFAPFLNSLSWAELNRAELLVVCWWRCCGCCCCCLYCCGVWVYCRQYGSKHTMPNQFTYHIIIVSI